METKMPASDDFRTEVRAQISRAIRQGRPHIEINAGEVHRKLGGSNRMPMLCNVMRQEAWYGRSENIFVPECGDGASLTIRYYFPRSRANNA
jgi:hypothetical protein